MLIYKRIVAPNGLPGFHVYTGTMVIGSIFNAGPSETNKATWYGVTPDGNRFDAMSKAKIASKLLADAGEVRAAKVVA